MSNSSLRKSEIVSSLLSNLPIGRSKVFNVDSVDIERCSISLRGGIQYKSEKGDRPVLELMEVFDVCCTLGRSSSHSLTASMIGRLLDDHAQW